MTTITTSEICQELQTLQKHRVWYTKSKNMLHNRLRATVAGCLGYETDLTEKERRKLFKEADQTIKQVLAGELDFDEEDLIKCTWIGIEQFEFAEKRFENEMKKLAKELLVYDWILDDQQKGAGVLTLATVVGEAGDLGNYPNPGKLWKRMGVAPYTKEGITLMGQTWKKRQNSRTEVKLDAEEWTEYGYVPRRRSISYLIGENLIKGNKSIYRERYDVKKKEQKDKYPEYSDMRVHLHGMLLACKLFYKMLWIEWRKYS